MTKWIELFHWLFTLKLLYVSSLSAGRPVLSDILRLVFAVLAVFSLLWHSRRHCSLSAGCTASNSGHSIGLLMNAAFLTANTFLTLLMTFPLSVNHCFLELYISLLLLIANTTWGRGTRDYSVLAKLYLSVWSISALQKLVHGRFLNGESFMSAWNTESRSDLGEVLDFIRGMAPHVDVNQLFVSLAIMVFVSELLLPLCIIVSPDKRYLWCGMFCLQIGVWLATAELSFALTGLALCVLGLKGPNAPLRTCSPVPRGIFIVLVVWPFVHMGLATAYDFSPWRLGGWGMYSTPSFTREYMLEFTVGTQRTYAFEDIPWPDDQYERIWRDHRLCLEFNSGRARERLENAFRNLVAPTFRSDAQVIRVRRDPSGLLAHVDNSP